MIQQGFLRDKPFIYESFATGKKLLNVENYIFPAITLNLSTH
jgi:hypothetical protein